MDDLEMELLLAPIVAGQRRLADGVGIDHEAGQ
jgi:hypothetical protein